MTGPPAGAARQITHQGAAWCSMVQHGAAVQQCEADEAAVYSNVGLMRQRCTAMWG